MSDSLRDLKKPVITERKIIAQTRLFRIEALDLRFSNGTETQYERILGSKRGGVLVVAMPDPDTVLLIREYSAGTHRYQLGFPKGRIEGEEPETEAGNRELMEEVGFGGKQLDYIAPLTLAPGYISHTTHLILARDLYPAQEEGDEPEPLEVIPWKLSNLDALLDRDDFDEARSIAALFLIRRYLKQHA